jgi:DNA modification methylase
MAHWSEEAKKLEIVSHRIDALDQLNYLGENTSEVSLFWFPFWRTTFDSRNSKQAVDKLVEYCSRLSETSVACFLTTPEDAALLVPNLEQHLRYQLWIAVKTPLDFDSDNPGRLPRRHAALLIFTKYRGSLRHTKTRVQYTYCPSCGKTTKDYGGKKHTYHEYGTMLSDVWRDFECNANENIDEVVNRLSDLFGLEPFQRLSVFDMRGCGELLPSNTLEEESLVQKVAAPNAAELASQLLNDDCISALKSLPDDSIDFCFADPPYNLKKKYDKWDDSLESVQYFDWCDRWLTELYRVLKPGRTLAVLNIPLWAVRHFQHLNSFMNFQAWIAWDGLGFPVRMIMPAHYAIICFSKGEPRPLPGFIDHPQKEEELYPLEEGYCLRANCVSKRARMRQSDRTDLSDLWHDVHRLKHNSRRVDHPCQLPPALMRRLHAIFSNPGEMILDCFNGAGTSTLTAQQINRRYIGIDISLQYHELALQRHEQLTNGIDPFGKMDSVPTAKNSPVQRLRKQKYKVSKKTLQLEIRRIAKELGRLPSKEDVSQSSQFPLEYFEQYFVSWGEVCAAARTTGMSENPNSTGSPYRKEQLDPYAATESLQD